MPEVKPTCPFCGTTEQNQWYADIWSCGTIGRVRVDIEQIQSKDCRIRQLESTVATLRKALEDVHEILRTDDKAYAEHDSVRKAISLIRVTALEETK